MASPFGTLVVVANPVAGKGRVGAQLPAIEQAIRSKGLEYRLVRTAGPGDATEATRQALAEGLTFLVAVGGDGTVHEVVNGMFDAAGGPIVPQPVLGVIPAGSGCDFVKTFGLPGDVIQACEHLEGGDVFPIDVGKITYLQQAGEPGLSYFPNIAEAGLGGAVVNKAAHLPRFFGGSRYFFGFWLTLPAFRRATVLVEADGRSYEGSAHNVVVANCQFYGGGMRISPRSWPSDGFLDVLVLKGPKSDSFTLLPKIYRGEHLPHRNIAEFRARAVRVQADRLLPIEADGEVLGTTPATFEVVPEAIRVKI